MDFRGTSFCTYPKKNYVVIKIKHKISMYLNSMNVYTLQTHSKSTDRQINNLFGRKFDETTITLLN